MEDQGDSDGATVLVRAARAMRMALSSMLILQMAGLLPARNWQQTGLS
jgi:hypothetical protein